MIAIEREPELLYGFPEWFYRIQRLAESVQAVSLDDLFGLCLTDS